MLEALKRRRDLLKNWRDWLISEKHSADRFRLVASQLWEARSRLIVYGDLEFFAGESASTREKLSDVFAGIETDDRDAAEKYLRDKIEMAESMIDVISKKESVSETDRESVKRLAASIRAECEHALGSLSGVADFQIPGADTMIADILQTDESDFGKLIADLLR